jgi:outer membrane protein assembly factor BamB
MRSNRFFPATLVAAATALVAALATPAHAQWHQEGFDAGKTFANSQESVLDRHNAALLQTRWQAQVGQFYASAASHAGERLFLCSNLYGVLAQSPDSGALLWTQFAGGVGNCGTPVLAGDQAYLVSSAFGPYRNVVSAIDQANGAVRWTSELPAGADNLGLGFGPALHNGRLFVTSARRAVVAVDAHDGRLLWEASTGGEAVLNNDPSVGGGRVFVSTWHDCCATAARQLFAFDAQTGRPLWASDVGPSNVQYPALVMNNHAVVVGSDSGEVHAFDPDSGRRLWTRQLAGYVSAPLAGHGKRVYAVSGNRDIQALDTATGEPLWQRSLRGSHQVASNLAWANGVLYFTTQDANGHQRLMALDANTGKSVATLNLSLRGAFSKLTVADGRVLLSTDGQLTLLSL